MMFHVEQNTKDLHCEAQDYLVTGEKFKVYLDENKIIGKTIPFPKKEEMSKYYKSEEYHPHSLKKKNLFSLLYSKARKYMQRKKLTWMKGFLKHNSNVLDYGCGSGSFVRYLRAKSVNAYGYDPNIKLNTLGEFNYITDKDTWKNKKYDIIFLWHVLEHIHNPFLLIENLKENLNKNGEIFVAIPNYKSHDSKYYGKYWAGYDLPRHLWHFTRESIYQIAKKTKFKIKKEKLLYLDSIYVSFLSEKNKANPFPFFLGLTTGLLSVLRSFFTRESSSLFFILKKI